VSASGSSTAPHDVPDPSPSPSVYIENLGCAKNQVDAETMGNRLIAAGWRWVDNSDDADLILVNSCGFIEPAQQETIDVTLDLTDRYPRTPVVMTGCLAQRYATEIADEMPELAGVFGNRAPERITELVARLFPDAAMPVSEGGGSSPAAGTTGTAGTTGAAVSDAPGQVGDRAAPPDSAPLVWTPDGDGPLSGSGRVRRLSRPGSAFMKVAEGCNHTCSFCAIPSIRGLLRSRPSRDIVAEFRELRGMGVAEFNLVAQDLAAWREPASRGIVALLEELLAEEGDFWIRLLYLYPDTFPEALLALAERDRRLLRYFDLSFQHASSRILTAMGRPGDAGRYLDLIAGIRDRLPDVALRSSFIVGFPGETEDDLRELEAFLAAARLEWVGVFAFSPQDGTPAAALTDELLPEAELEARRSRIMELQAPIATERLARFVGQTLPVIVEEPFASGDLAFGRSPLQAPDVDGLVVIHGAGSFGSAPLEAGQMVTVEVTGVTGFDMQATLVSPRPAL
jgi:ribosomal protein S12 methylthiotransferase